MGTPAYKKEVWVAEAKTDEDGKLDLDDDGLPQPEDGTWEKVPAQTASLDQSGTVLDDSAIGFYDGQRRRLIGLLEWGITMTVNYDTGGAGGDAVDIIRSAWLGRKPLIAQYLPTGSTDDGFQGPVVVENFNMTGGVDDLETVDVNLLSNGPLADAEERED